MNENDENKYVQNNEPVVPNEVPVTNETPVETEVPNETPVQNEVPTFNEAPVRNEVPNETPVQNEVPTFNETPVRNEVPNEIPVQNEAPIYNETPIQNEIPEEPKEKSNWYWIIYILAAIIIFVIILLLLKGCNGLRNKNKSKINEANEWVTNMWNKCVDPVYWYTVDGTGVNGADINIDTTLADCDTYYEEYKTKKKDIAALDNSYSDFKETYNKISEQIDIIYPQIKANKPIAKENVDYEENMEIFYEYQVKLYNLIKEKYS